jgi:hypothetical protein
MNHQLNESQLVRAVSDLIGGGGTLILPDISKHDASRYSEMLSRNGYFTSSSRHGSPIGLPIRRSTSSGTSIVYVSNYDLTVKKNKTSGEVAYA